MSTDQCMGKICNTTCQQSCNDSLVVIRLCVEVILQLEVILDLLNKEESSLGMQPTLLGDLLNINLDI